MMLCMKRGLFYAGLVLLLYLAVLLAMAPASVLTGAVAKASAGYVTITDAAGSLWRGQGELHVRIRGRSQTLGVLTWHVLPWAVLTGKLKADVGMETRDGVLTGLVVLGFGGVQLASISAAASAELIEDLVAPGMWGARGQVQLEASNVSVDADGFHGGADVYWRAAGNRFVAVDPLGDYRLRLNAEGKTFAFHIDTLTGALSVAGEGAWDLTARQVKFDGSARPLERAAELEPLLALFGPDAGEGRRDLAIALPVN